MKCLHFEITHQTKQQIILSWNHKNVYFILFFNNAIYLYLTLKEYLSLSIHGSGIGQRLTQSRFVS